MFRLHTELLEHTQKRRIGDIAESGKELAEVFVGSLDPQVAIGEIAGRDRIAEIEKAELENIRSIEELFECRDPPPVSLAFAQPNIERDLDLAFRRRLGRGRNIGRWPDRFV